MKSFCTVQQFGQRAALNHKRQNKEEATKNSFSQTGGCETNLRICDTVGPVSGLRCSRYTGVDVLEWYAVMTGISAAGVRWLWHPTGVVGQCTYCESGQGILEMLIGAREPVSPAVKHHCLLVIALVCSDTKLCLSASRAWKSQMVQSPPIP